MSASEKNRAKDKAKSRLKDNKGEKGGIDTLGVIAGGGNLPARLLHACDRAGIEVFVIGFEGQTDPALFEGRQYMLTRVGAAGQIVNTLQSHHIKDLVLIGSMHRPGVSDVRPDMRTAKFLLKVGLKAMGDDGLLRTIKNELAEEGFTIHGVQRFVKDILTGKGPVGSHKPGKDDWIDIEHGIAVSQKLGEIDVGQAVIVQQGIVLGVEAAEGTDELIRRCGAYKRGGRGGVLVKTCKPQQDRDLDLPAIGPETVACCAAAGLAGIAVQAGRSLLLDPEKVAALADKNKIFVTGVA